MATTSLRTPPRNHPQKPSQTSPSVGLPSTSSSPPSKMTPSIDDIKETARLAAAQIERTIAPDYPRRFRNINEAKEYIKDLCRDAGYDYMLGRYNLRTGSLHPIAEAVKDRAAFLVAIRAYSDQEFYLDEEVPDRQKLRDAVEANVARALSTIKVWPSRFEGADVASNWVQRTCSQRGLAFTRFEGLTIGKFHGYVGWNTVRKAWEEGKVQLDDVPKGWVRTISSMKDAIDSDIARLQQMIRNWPTSFPHLNAARNFVAEWCWSHRFRYTGWENVEPRRYSLYVNWAMAKQGLAGGLFKVDGANPSPTLPRPVIDRNKDGKEKYDAKVRAWMDYTTHGNDERTNNVTGPPDAIPDLMVNDVDILRADSASPPSSVSVSSDDTAAPSLSKYSGSDNTLIDLEEEVAEPQLDARDKARVDPFMGLVMELKRGYGMKMVAEAVVGEEAVTEPVDIIKIAFD